MFPKPFRNFSRGDGMDEYLLGLGLWRKTIPKDESCLYRAVSEQVFSTQALHEQVMKACRRYVERHCVELANDWLGPLEIKALSLLYKRDFIIYKQPGKEPTNVTNLGFNDQVVLCFSGSNHYDSVYSRSFMENSALCQSVLYELLYESVFGVDQPIRKGQDMISTKPSQVKHNIISMVQDKQTLSCCAVCEPSASACLMHERPSYHSTPFPYKVAKSLSVEVFRNVEYDAWLETKKEEQSLAYQDHLGAVSGSANFTPGDKCQVILDGHGDHQFNAHVQEVRSDSESAVVFVEELGERQVVQWSKMTPLPKMISMESSWKKRGKKKICECSRSVLVDGDSYVSSKSRPSAHCQYMGRRLRINSAGLPIKVPAHDGAGNLHARPFGKTSNHVKDVFSTLGPRLKNPLRQRYNSEGHYSDEVEAKQYDDLVFCEQPDQKDAQIHSEDSNGDQQLQEWNPLECREPEYADTAEGITAYHPLPVFSDECDQGEMIVSVPMKVVGTTPQHLQLEKILPPLPPSPSAVSTMVQALPEMVSSPMAQPMMTHQPGYFVVLPHPNFMIPVSDNFAGPINTNASISAEPSGQDLPLHDIATLRFFFNMGLQYYRSMLLVQQHSPQSAPPYYSYPASNGTGVCMPPGPVVAPEIYAVPENDMFTGGSFCQTGLSQQSGTIYFSSPPQCPLPPYFQFGTASVQYQQ